jgi:hypothetical protein
MTCLGRGELSVERTSRRWFDFRSYENVVTCEKKHQEIDIKNEGMTLSYTLPSLVLRQVSRPINCRVVRLPQGGCLIAQSQICLSDVTADEVEIAM